MNTQSLGIGCYKRATCPEMTLDIPPGGWNMLKFRFLWEQWLPSHGELYCLKELEVPSCLLKQRAAGLPRQLLYMVA